VSCSNESQLRGSENPPRPTSLLVGPTAWGLLVAAIIGLFLYLPHTQAPTNSVTVQASASPSVPRILRALPVVHEPEVRRAAPVEVRRALPVVGQHYIVELPDGIRLLSIWRGTLANPGDLPTSGNQIGDAWATGTGSASHTWIWAIARGQTIPY
jgi:hypothetical protein